MPKKDRTNSIGKFDQIIGGKITCARAYKDWSQKELAMILDMPLIDLQSHELGMKSISAVQILKYSLALDRTVDYFLEPVRTEILDRYKKRKPY